MIPEFVPYPDSRLSERAAPRPVDASLRATGDRLKAAAIAASAYGLAAAHIGETAPVVVVNIAGEAEQRSDLLLFNPRVTGMAEALERGTEGSVSMPGLQVEIDRPQWVDVAYEDEAGTRQARRFEGLAARIAQHEIEQMNGTFFLSRLSRLKREMVLKKWKKRAG